MPATPTAPRAAPRTVAGTPSVDRVGDERREPAELFRRRRIVVQEALREAHDADVQAAHEVGLRAGGADGELGAAAADVGEHQRPARPAGELCRAAAEGERALLFAAEHARGHGEVARDAVEEAAAVGRVAKHAGGHEQAPRRAVGLEARRIPSQAGARARDGGGVETPGPVDALAEPDHGRQARLRPAPRRPSPDLRQKQTAGVGAEVDDGDPHGAASGRARTPRSAVIAPRLLDLRQHGLGRRRRPGARGRGRRARAGT